MYQIRMLIFLALLLTGCNQQRGNFIVSSRTSTDWKDAMGGCEMLIGYRTQDPKNKKLLLAYVMIDLNADSKTRNFNGGDGVFVSATNIDYNGNGSTFHVGSAWNRTSNVVVLDDKEFDRLNGNVFLILRTDEGQNKIQVPGNCNADTPEALLDYLRNNTDLESKYTEGIDQIMIE